MKAYLLLRNNTQLGPLSLQELCNLGMRTSDLVWVDRESYAWKHPYEIPELKMYAPVPEDSVYNATLTDLELLQHQKKHAFSPATLTFSERISKSNPVSDSGIVPTIEMESRESDIKVIAPNKDNIVIRTIKSGRSENNHLLHVQIREVGGDNVVQKSDVNSVVPVNEKQPYVLDGRAEGTESRHASEDVIDDTAIVQNIWPNKLELGVLCVGVLSVLAVLYLIFTTS